MTSPAVLCSSDTSPGGLAQALKEEGNSLYAQRAYARCVAVYTKALEALDANAEDVSKSSTLRTLFLQIYANRSLAYLRLGQWGLAEADGGRGEALGAAHGAIPLSDVDRGLVYKVGYRRAVALCMLGEADAGLKCVGVLDEGLHGGEDEDLRLLVEQLHVLKAWKAREERINEVDQNEVGRLVALLWKDVLGDDDDDGVSGGDDQHVSPLDLLEQLIKLVDENIDGNIENCFHIVSNTRLLLYLMNTPSTRPTVCRLLSATAAASIAWPREMWEFVVGCACGKKSLGEGEIDGYARDCMGVLLEVARRNVWVRDWVMTRCWEERDGGCDDVLCGISIVEMIAKMVQTCHLSKRRVGKDAVVAGCGVLAAYASRGSSVGQLKALCEAHVVISMLTSFENAKEIVWERDPSADADGEVGGACEMVDDREDEDVEQRAKRELIKKQRDVYDPLTIDLQKAILAHLKTMFGSKALMMSELVEWKGGRKCASQVHHRIVALGRRLVSKCPKRSTKVYDGTLNVLSYEKRPYAADFNDHPAGDFLATLDLEGLASATEKDLSSSPLLDEFLGAILVVLDFDPGFVTKLLFKAGLLSLCEELSVFVSPSTVVLAQQICARMLCGVKEARQALLESSNVVLLAGILVNKAVEDAELGAFALGELVCGAPSCSGNDFKYLIDKDSGVLPFLKGAMARPMLNGSNMVVRLTAELAKRTVSCNSYRVTKTGKKIPKGHAWGCFDAEVLETVMYSPSKAVPAATDSITDGNQLGTGFARGFFSKLDAKTRANTAKESWEKGAKGPDTSATSKNPDVTPDHPTPDTKEAVPTSQRCQIVEIQAENDDKKSPAKTAAETAAITPTFHPCTDNANDTDDTEDCDVYEVYDSTPASAIREARAAWMAMDQTKKITWEQTSSDVVAKIKVPEGITSAKDVSVSCTSTSITVNLKWYGKILHGELFGGIKAHEFTWCLNDDSEIYIVLPKDGKEHWWKTLIQGWEEKGYYELLKDAVDADEPHVAYDDMDEGAKDLLDSMLERQAYINSGMLDLENGFDDFRIVLSDNSLGGDTTR